MATLWIFIQFLLVCFAASYFASESNVIKADPLGPRVAGVFGLIRGGKYTLNFTSAREACSFLNVTIASRDQMERAVQRGLEMCKYGWIAEQIAAIPRITSDSNCGQGKTGLVLWYASAKQKFGVFCFNASDSEETPTSTSPTSTSPTSTSPTPTSPTSTSPTATSPTFTSPTSTSPTPTSPTRRTSLTPTPTLTTPTVESTTGAAASSRKPKTTESPEQTSVSTLLVETTRSTGISSAHTPTSLSDLISSNPTVQTVFTSVSVLPPSQSLAKTVLGGVPLALILLVVTLSLLTAAGAVWYYKLKPGWSVGRQRDDTETEMWKHTDSETDLHSRHGAEEEDEDEDGYEEPDRKYSSDITLCVNPDIKDHFSE